MVGRLDDWMHDWVNVCVGCLLVAARAYGKLIHARGPATNNQPTHTIPQPCTQSPIHTIIRPYTHSHPFTQPFNLQPIHSPIHSLIHLSINPPIYSSTNPFIHQTTHPS